jgi:hypothetical protein
MQRLGKTILVWTVVLLMAVDPASAGRWRASRCCPPPCCYTPCYTSCCVVSECCTIEGSATPAPELAPAPQSNAPKAQPTPARPAPSTLAPALRVQQVPPPAAPLPVPTEEMPPEEPAAAEPAAETPEPAKEDEMPEEPARPAKPAEDVEDLFKDSDSKSTETAPPAETKPAGKSEDVEDLFKDTDTDSKKSTSIEAVPAADRNTVSRELEDLFVEPADAARSASAETPTNSMRVWTDNTGKFQVNARLVVVGPKHVRLLKDNGRLTTVPFSRLSQSDLAFVHAQAVDAIAGNF